MHARLLVLLGLLMTVSGVQAAVNEPYTHDVKFGNGAVFDTLAKVAPSDPTLASGRRVVLDDDGTTVVAGMATAHLFSDVKFLVVVRYDSLGQRVAWSQPTTGYVDGSGKYLLIQPATAPENLRLAAVRDVKVGSYGDIHVLIDAYEPAPSTETDSLVVTFGQDGTYKGIVTHKATPGVSDVGTALLEWGSDVFIVSSTDTHVDVARYSLNLSNGVPALDTGWANMGWATQSLFKCHHTVGGIPVTVPCPLQATRALIRYGGMTNASIYVGGDYETSVGSLGSSLFVMNFGLLGSTSATGFPVTWDLDGGVDDRLQGMAARNKYYTPAHPQDELYLLDAFQRPCGRGFVVVRINAETGAYLSRSYTTGGSTTTDPNVCATVPSVVATDLALLMGPNNANRYVAVVGGRTSGTLYTGENGFVALHDVQDLHVTPQGQDFTNNAGMDPADTEFLSAQADATNGLTVTGSNVSFDQDYSSAVTMRLVPDRIFRHGFDSTTAD